MKSKGLEDKLLKIERNICIYSKLEKNIVEEINIDFIPINFLKEIVFNTEEDPLLYDGYVLNLEQLNEINLKFKIQLTFNVELYDHVLEANGIYNW